MWVDTDGRHVLVNTANGRVKVRNVKRDDRVALCVFDHDDPRKRVIIRGRVLEIAEDDGNQHVDRLAKKYRGEATYRGRRPDEQRIIFRIEPEHLNSSGLE
jgi:PPOX class probable F420-dependent enzyme